MANFNLVYGINKHGKGNDDLKCHITEKGGNGVQLVMGGGIPEEADASIDDAIDMLVAAAESLPDLPSKDPANHAKYLRAVAGFSNQLADALDPPA